MLSAEQLPSLLPVVMSIKSLLERNQTMTRFNGCCPLTASFCIRCQLWIRDFEYLQSQGMIVSKSDIPVADWPYQAGPCQPAGPLAPAYTTKVPGHRALVSQHLG